MRLSTGDELLKRASCLTPAYIHDIIRGYLKNNTSTTFFEINCSKNGQG